MAKASFANPGRFYTITGWLNPVLAFLFVPMFAIGGYLAMFVAPADYLQGETVRIMFVHVPAAWLSLFIYATMSLSALAILVFRHPLAEVSLRAALLPGAAFTFLALVTGALWGKPTWGAYWVWDARLTSMLILLFIYLGLIALSQAIEEPGRAGRIVAIATLFGAINLPIVKFSVDWWNTLHQPASVLRAGGPAIHSSLFVPLIVMAGAFFCFSLWLHIAAMRNEILRRRVVSLQKKQIANLRSALATETQFK